MSTVAIDIDSTLYDFETVFRQAYIDIAIENGNKSLFRGAYSSWVEWRSPRDVCGEEAFQQALERVHTYDVITSRNPYEGSSDVLCSLKDAGHELLYISNRSKSLFDPTREWINKNFPQGDLICTMNDKQSELSDCQYIIDDRPKTLCEFLYNNSWQGSPRIAFGLLFEYNRALTDIPNVYLAPTWAGIKFYLQREEVIEDGIYSNA